MYASFLIFFNSFVYFYANSVSTMCIYHDYCVYHYKSTELVCLYTLDIGLQINIIIIIMLSFLLCVLQRNWGSNVHIIYLFSCVILMCI